MSRWLLSVAVLTAAFSPCIARAQNATADALSAPRVRERIRLSPARDKDRSINYAVDERQTLDTLSSNKTFVASDAISVVARNPNPLTTQMTAGIEEADDPSHSAVLKLVDAMLAIPTIVQPQVETVRSQVESQRARIASTQRLELRERCDAADKVVALYEALHPASATRAELGKAVARWRDSLGNDPAGVRAALQGETGVISSVRTYSMALGKEIDTADSLIKEMERDVVPSGATDECGQLRAGLYAVALLSEPRRRLSDLEHIRGTVADLAAALSEFADARHWVGASDDYVLATVRPTLAKMQKVTVKFFQLDYGVADDRSGLTLKATDAGAGTFTVRQFDRFVVETAAGIIRSNLKRPVYGTTQNAAGQTIAVRADDDDVSWDAAVMGNFVCRCGWGQVLTPMVQIGALASKESPALLAGGGFRLFALPKGSIGIGLGLAFGWVKRLPGAMLGVPISGTKDIEANLRFENQQSFYFTLQYAF